MVSMFREPAMSYSCIVGHIEDASAAFHSWSLRSDDNLPTAMEWPPSWSPRPRALQPKRHANVLPNVMIPNRR